MKFYLSLEKRMIVGPEYRMQHDSAWRQVETQESLKENDFFSVDLNQAAARIVRGQEIEIDGEKYLAHPKGPHGFGNYVYPAVRVKREKKVKVPDYDQMVQTLVSGDDRKNNTLSLNLNADFELYNLRQARRDNSGVAVRSETFIVGNGYVGMHAGNDSNFTNSTYALMLEGWLSHLKMGKLDVFQDCRLGRESIEELVEMIESLSE